MASLADRDLPPDGVTLADIGRLPPIAPIPRYASETLRPQYELPPWWTSTAEMRTSPEAPSDIYNRNVTETLLSAGVPTRVAEQLGPKLGGALQMVSPVGIVTSAEDAVYHAGRGEYLPMTVAALGAVPGAGKLGGKAIGRAGKAIAEALPMDEASRMARAKEMGFFTDAPVYHGTATEFPAFSLTPPARNSHGPLAQTGVSTTRDPAYASDFAALSARLGTGSSPQVLPLVLRAEKPARIDATGLSLEEMAVAVRDAWAAGHDAMLIQNYTRGAFEKVASTDHVIVRNPNQLRSRFAAFDPSKRDLNDLLAGIALPGMVGAGAILDAASQDQGQ